MDVGLMDRIKSVGFGELTLRPYCVESIARSDKKGFFNSKQAGQVNERQGGPENPRYEISSCKVALSGENR